ncbi:MULTISPECIES: type III secretion system cytoplasmic ring protein SctQ [Luteimonas]|uniref:type III secretion system cytoplasmic ring protein SctQ n=1 Tax=Luteimonas TaxID=83614 RepID=UPI000C7B505C|nr:MULTISPECIES: type III secretion system cytoplasmic ring protein SctQ [Luteimonas]
MADSALAPRPASPAPASLRGRLPQVSAALVEALRTFHDRARHWPAGDTRLSLQTARRPPGDAPGVELDAEGSRLGLWLRSGDAAAADDALHWQDYQGRARVLAWSLAHEAPLMRLSDALGTSLLPLVDADPAPTADCVWLDFSLPATGDAPALAGTLRLPVDWLGLLRTRAQPGGAPELGAWRQLTAAVRIALTVPPLPVADFRSLRPGDVVLAGNVRLPPLVAEAVGRRWPVRQTAEGWRVDGPAAPAPVHARSAPSRLETAPMTQQDAAPDAPNDDTSASPADPAATLPVQVDFDLGQVELTLGELAGLQPGYVFALPAHLEGANVAIRANGRVAGQGELVAVGDTLGVRLLSWS